MPDDTNPRGRSAALVVFLLFLIYNSNFRLIRSGDTIPARLLPFSLLLDRSQFLDRWVEPYLPEANKIYGIYFLYRFHHHWMSSYPSLTPLVVTPLYLAPAIWLARQHPPLSDGDVVLVAMIDVMEKLSATLIAAISVGILYLALRKIVSHELSLAVALIYGLASNTWTISSQALWRHGLSELSFALLLWALVREPVTPASSLWAGLALALAAANKPGNALIALVLVVYFARNHRDKLLWFSTPLFVFGLLSLAYNLYYFGHPLGLVANPYSKVGPEMVFDLSHSTFGDGLVGLLVAPSRGLLIYTPWVVFAFWGAVRTWRERTFGWARYLLVGMVAIFLGHANFWGWWGGWCYGPRYLTDILPLMAFLLISVWRRITSVRLLRFAFVLAVLAALWVQVVGAFYYPNGLWDGKPVNVDRATRRLWDWSDTQISRSWRAGPAPPWLFDEMYLVSSQIVTRDPPRQDK